MKRVYEPRKTKEMEVVVVKENPLLKLERFDQSILLDFIRGGMITSGEFAELIKEDGLRGVTLTPSILSNPVLREGPLRLYSQQTAISLSEALRQFRAQYSRKSSRKNLDIWSKTDVRVQKRSMLERETQLSIASERASRSVSLWVRL
jgi:hypothetical protein